MSLSALSWALDIPTIRGSRKSVLMYLAFRANKELQCFPSVPRMAKELGISPRTVQYALRGLEKDKLVKVRLRKGSAGRTTSNLYTLMVDGSEIAPHPQQELHHPPASDAPSFMNLQINLHSENLEATETGSKENYVSSVKQQMEELLQPQTEEEAVSKCVAVNGKYSAVKLAALWRDLHRIHHKGTFLSGTSMKRVGQLSNFAKAADKDTVPALCAIIRNWMGFGKYVKECGLCTDFPDNPHIGFALLHVDKAVEFVSSEKSAYTYTGKMKMLA